MEPNNDKYTTTGEPRANVQPVYVAVSPPSDGGIDLLELWTTLWRGKWVIIVVTTIFGVAGIVYSLSIAPVYRAEVLLAPVSRDQSSDLGGLGGLASLAGIRLNANADNSHTLAVLQSKNFVAEFIRDKGLLPVLFPEEWDAVNQQWIGSDREGHHDIRDGVKAFIESVLSITQDQETGLVTLGIEWTDPDTTAQWATELVKRINARTRKQDIEESQRKLDYLNEQLGKASLVELRLAISRVIEEQISAMMLAQSQIEYAFEVIDPAIVPKQRIRPKRTIIVIIATLLGGVCAVFFLLARFGIKRLQSNASA